MTQARQQRWQALLLLCLLAMATPLWAAWPDESNWIPILQGTDPITDPEGDTAGSRDIVGTTTDPAAYIFNDGSHLYFRIRLDEDPRHGTGLQPFGWGILIDTDLNAADYEYMLMVDGIVNPEAFYLAKNTTKTYISDPSDKAETIVWTEAASRDPTSGNYRITRVADVGGPQDLFGSGADDYFIDFRIPYSVVEAELGLTDNSLIRFFVGSSNSAQTLSADLLGSDLNDVSPPTPPTGVTPTDGAVRFTDSAYSADVSSFQATDYLYIEVTDGDVNSISTEAETVTVTLTTPNGDSLTVTLTESGVNTGVFVGSAPTESNATPNTGDTILQVDPIETVTVTYIDAVDGTTPTPNQDVSRTDTIQAQPLADLGLSKTFPTAAHATPNVGDEIMYRITLTNDGPSDSIGAEILDQLPAEVSYDRHEPAAANYNPTSGIWTVGALANGASTTLDIYVTVDAAGTPPITNTASIDSAVQADDNAANDSASVSFAVAGADLNLSKSVSAETANTGDNVTFTVTLLNQGSSTANNIVISDPLPVGLSYVSDDSGGSYNSGSGDWTVGSLANGASATLNIVAQVTAASGSTVTNTASVGTVDEADPDSSDNSASASVYVGGTDLSVTKTILGGAATADEGEAVTYVLTVTNNGPNDATGVQVSDVLPSGVTWSSDNSGGAYNTGTGVWTIGNLSNGGSASIDIVVTVDSNTAGNTITNTATVSNTTGQLDPNSGNDSASVAFTVEYANLEAIKTVNDETPSDGDTVTFTLSITNHGNATATNIQASDYFPDQVDTVTDGGGDGSWSYSSTTHTGTWTIASLAVGATATRTITAVVNLASGDPLSFFNTLNIDGADQADPVTSNNSDSASLRVDAADIQVVKALTTTDSPVVGETVTFTVTVSNNGPNTATSLQVTDAMPAGLTYVSHTVSRGSFNSGSGVWTVLTGGDKNFLNGDSATLTINATVDAGTDGTSLTNYASVSAVDQSDNVSSNDTSSATVYVGGKDLVMSKSVDNPAPNAGDTITYTLTVTNSGPSAATGVEVTDLLPSGVTYVSDDGGGAYVSGTGVWTVGNLANGASAILNITATVDAAAAGTNVNNCAEITAYSGLDSDTGNNTACAEIAVTQVFITMSQTSDDSSPSELTDVTFTVTVKNLGPDTVTNLVISELVPIAGFTYQSSTVSTGTFVDSDTNGMPDEWTIASLAKGETATLSITVTVNAGTGGTTYAIQACVVSLDQTNLNEANDCATTYVTVVGAPAITLLKTVQTIYDPVSNTTNPHAIPGAWVKYSIFASNSGGASPNADSIVVTDPRPVNTELCVSGACLSGADPVQYLDPDSDAGLSYSFIGLNSSTDDVDFSNDGGTTWTYYHDSDYSNIDADGFDSTVTHIRINPKGSFAAAGGGVVPDFQLDFIVRVQ